MNISSDALRKLANLNLNPEQMAGVLAILADGIDKEEERKKKQAERKRVSRDRHRTVTGQSQDILPPLVPPSDGFPHPSLTPPLNPPQPKKNINIKKNVFVRPEDIPEQPWNAWMETRRRKNAANTVHALELAVKKLRQLSNLGHDPTDVLNQSVLRGYTGLFEIKQENQNGNGNLSKPTYTAKPTYQSEAERLIAKFSAEAARQNAIDNGTGSSMRITEAIR